MRTAHGAEELGLCPHGHACQAGAWGRYIGFCLVLKSLRFNYDSANAQNRHFGMALTSPVLSFWHCFESGGGLGSKSQ